MEIDKLLYDSFISRRALGNKAIGVFDIPLDKLKAHPALRSLDTQHIEELKKWIDTYGYDKRFPISVSVSRDIEECMKLPIKAFEVLDGMHRIEAMRSLKYRKIPAIVYQGLSESEKIQVIIESNTQKELTKSDYGKIVEYLRELGYSYRQIGKKLGMTWQEARASYLQWLADKTWKNTSISKYLTKTQLGLLFKGTGLVEKKLELARAILDLKQSFKLHPSDVLRRALIVWRDKYSYSSDSLFEILKSISERGLYQSQVVLKTYEIPELEIVKEWCNRHSLSFHKECVWIFKAGYKEWIKARRKSL